SRPWSALAVPGALTDRMLTLLAECGCPFPLILSSPTHAFFSLRTLRAFLRSGGEIGYVTRSRLIGIAVNPASPEGDFFNPREMKRRIAEVCRPVPVLDAIRDGFRGGEGPESGRWECVPGRRDHAAPAVGGRLSPLSCADAGGTGFPGEVDSLSSGS